jgi:hypothetical protein
MTMARSTEITEFGSLCVVAVMDVINAGAYITTDGANRRGRI